MERQLTLSEQSVKVAQTVGRIYFRNDEDLQADLISKSWEFSLTAGENATASTIVTFAVKHVRSGRQFPVTTRSVEARRKDGPNFTRHPVDVMELPNDDSSPVETAIMRVDLAAFVATLSDRQRELLEAMLLGETTSDMAHLFGLTAGRIAQLRRELHGRLQVFLS